MMIARHITTLMLLCGCAGAALAQQLDARFSCSANGEDGGERVLYADNGEVRIQGNKIETFRWESSLFRSTHGFDCSIDESDGLKAEAVGDDKKDAWRVRLVDARAARGRRGYDFKTSYNCTIRLLHEGDMLLVRPSCPALCGSRPNFSALSVNLRTGTCLYEE